MGRLLDITAGPSQMEGKQAGTVQHTENYKEMVEKQRHESKNRGIFEPGRARGDCLVAFQIKTHFLRECC